MKGEIKIFCCLPEEAAVVRSEVFIKEQGFPYDYDEKDDISIHFVMFDGSKPVAACRVFESENKGEYILGRLAVLKQYRGQGRGAEMVKSAVEYVADMGGESLILHSQMHSVGFYEKLGFETFSEVEDDAGAPHIWMLKKLK